MFSIWGQARHDSINKYRDIELDKGIFCIAKDIGGDSEFYEECGG